MAIRFKSALDVLKKEAGEDDLPKKEAVPKKEADVLERPAQKIGSTAGQIAMNTAELWLAQTVGGKWRKP